MRYLLLPYLLFVLATNAFADKVGTDKFGDIVANGEKIFVTLQYDGRRMDLHSEIFFEISGKNPGLFLSFYPDVATKESPMTQHIIITDATRDKVRRSNVLDTGIDFQWGDNNYVIFEGNAMYFGIYKRNCNENSCRTTTVPHRMQFVYRDGKLEENKGQWRGPAKPEVFIQPTGKDPCFNVNGVEACREEIEREKAANRKRKAAASATTK